MSKIQEAYEWVKSFKLSAIKNIDLLKTMTIRKLKAIASKINKELGVIITKAMFGKSRSEMNKQELIDAIWYVRSVQLASPRGGQYEIKQLAERIFAMVADARTEEEVTVCHYFAFNKTHEGTAEQNATRFYNRLLEKGVCQLASIRNADRLAKFGAEVEVKVWGIKPQTLIKLMNKVEKPKLEDIPLVKASELKPANNIVSKPINFTVGSRFLVMVDNTGWQGREGEIVQELPDAIWAVMDDSPGGRVQFKKASIKLTKEVTIEDHIRICQQMYDNAKGKTERWVNTIIESIHRRGLQVVNDVVDVRF